MTIITAPNFSEIRIDEDTLNLRIDTLLEIPIDFYPSRTPITARLAVTSGAPRNMAHIGGHAGLNASSRGGTRIRAA